MPTTVFPNCPCCGPASGSGSGSSCRGWYCCRRTGQVSYAANCTQAAALRSACAPPTETVNCGGGQPTRVVPRTLYVEFGGAWAALGTIAYLWNGGPFGAGFYVWGDGTGLGGTVPLTACGQTLDSEISICGTLADGKLVIQLGGIGSSIVCLVSAPGGGGVTAISQFTVLNWEPFETDTITAELFQGGAGPCPCLGEEITIKITGDGGGVGLLGPFRTLAEADAACGSGSGSGGRRYTTCNDCFGAERPVGSYPANLTVTYIDHGGVTVTVPHASGGEYIADAPDIAYLKGMYAQPILCGYAGTLIAAFRGCVVDETVTIQMISCNPIILYGATPFGTVVITEDGSSPALPSLGSTVPACDGISGTLDVTTGGGPACLPESFQIVRSLITSVGLCDYWYGTGVAPDCSCDDSNFILNCTGADPGTWVATFGGFTLTLAGQTASPFSLTYTLPADYECGAATIPAGTTFVVTEP
jgi:hypothetical protein